MTVVVLLPGSGCGSARPEPLGLKLMRCEWRSCAGIARVKLKKGECGAEATQVKLRRRELRSRTDAARLQSRARATRVKVDVMRATNQIRSRSGEVDAMQEAKQVRGRSGEVVAMQADSRPPAARVRLMRCKQQCKTEAAQV
ncbi:hypothetical protein NDU88_011155 [Pleurodeles waltl]|uniref:Uncharacterized protein n=1 Tax=Pleurodeles waltl TaxID=8319 RepID=A0AAV7S3A5_PLEWA|nr:hypothetical protein NDU88_011155 [Pleurodeles waltl]